jgi:hypothetical protein
MKLYYFDMGGKAEATRLLLMLGGVPFEDVKLTRCGHAERWRDPTKDVHCNTKISTQRICLGVVCSGRVIASALACGSC